MILGRFCLRIVVKGYWLLTQWIFALATYRVSTWQTAPRTDSACVVLLYACDVFAELVEVAT